MRIGALHGHSSASHGCGEGACFDEKRAALHGSTSVPRDTAQAVSEESVEIVRKAFAAFSRDDLEGTLEYFAPDLEFYPTGRFMDTQKVYHGQEEWTAFWHTFHEAWEELTISIERIEDVDGRVLVLGIFHGIGRGSGVETSVEAAWLVTLRDGLFAVNHSFASWGEALEAAGLTE